MAPQILYELLQKPAASQLDIHFVHTAVCIVFLMLEKEPELTKRHIVQQLLKPLSAWGITPPPDQLVLVEESVRVFLRDNK